MGLAVQVLAGRVTLPDLMRFFGLEMRDGRVLLSENSQFRGGGGNSKDSGAPGFRGGGTPDGRGTMAPTSSGGGRLDISRDSGTPNR